MTKDREMEIRNWIACLSEIYKEGNPCVERRVMGATLEALDDLATLQSHLAAAQERVRRFRVALETAIELTHTPEHAQDAEWYQKQARVIATLDEVNT